MPNMSQYLTVKLLSDISQKFSLPVSIFEYPTTVIETSQRFAQPVSLSRKGHDTVRNFSAGQRAQRPIVSNMVFLLMFQLLYVVDMYLTKYYIYYRHVILD